MGSIDNLTTSVDLIVVGGGPTGLLTALLCQRLGASVAVIDAKPGPLALGRADALNARTQQYLEVVGVLDHLRAQGIICNTSSIYANGSFQSRQSHWWTSLKHVWQKNFLMIGQPVVEEILSSQLCSVVFYGESVNDISENIDGVRVSTDRGNTFHAKYCVAADGARSMVRQSLNIGFHGTKPEMTWAVMDAFLDTDFPRCDEIITFELNGQSRVAWIPRERDMARFYILLDGKITEEKCKASIKQHMMPYRVDFVAIEWFSTFEVKERVASTFISQDGAGKIFLAGDAAHVHSVNGGQGLNTGIADAFALSWRLGHVLTHQDLQPDAKGTILRSYDIERRAVAQQVVNVAAKLVRDTTHEATQYVGSIEKNSSHITGMGISYEGLQSPAIRDSQHGLFTAGQPCPDLYLTLDGQPTANRLYSMVEYGKYLVLAIGDPPMPKVKLSESIVWLSIQAETTEGPPTANVGNKSYRANFVGRNDSYTVVIRPDMYVGCVASDGSWKAYLEIVLGI
ncbi:hypothetical protein NM208_g11828 [Fusarium decemcellulare]|uniref:Uncharacterized protein n=1 Tax=Fusarium decemcellulare TaxID=57161 RepID=A0ACC1RSU7_9HYPO|nr:hypothetical protein NM208_g11828 [Fusarium decemcellulare]